MPWRDLRANRLMIFSLDILAERRQACAFMPHPRALHQFRKCGKRVAGIKEDAPASLGSSPKPMNSTDELAPIIIR
jgi:hypothetical protein